MSGRSGMELALQAGLKASRQYAGVPVTYTRDQTTITINNAVQGQMRHGTMSHVGQDTIVLFSDWLIDRKEMTLGDPQLGDQIRRTVNNVLNIYFVEQMEMGDHHWDWSDTGRTQYRIRTRKIETIISQPRGYDITGHEMNYE